MAKTYEELLAGATQIKNNELPESNTHSLIGGQLLDMVEKQKEDSERIDNVSKSHKGYFQTLEQLKAKYPTPKEGETAWVGESYPGNVYDVVDGAWHDTGVPANEGGGSGTSNYNDLENKPSIGNVSLEGNKTLDELGIASKESLNGKVNVESGKGLSTNDFTDDEKEKLIGIEKGATKNIVDTDFSLESENSLQNKIVTETINEIKNTIESILGINTKFVGYYDTQGSLPSVSEDSWAFVGNLSSVSVYAYYTNSTGNYGVGWNKLVNIGTYDFTNYNDFIKSINNSTNTLIDLDISDEKGYILAEFADGHFKTGKFDSRKTTTLEDSASDLDISDEKGNIIVQFAKGHIKTKNFDSRNIEIDTESVINSSLRGKIISILGDSISTFGTPDQNNSIGTWTYPGNRCRYPQPDLLIDVNQTWWKLLLDNTGAILGINESWAGSQVSNSQISDSGDLGPNRCISSITRISHLRNNGEPDIILIYAGTNDAGRSVEIGAFNTENPMNYNESIIKSLDVTTFANAYRAMLIRLQYYYPKSKIVVMMPNFTTSYYTITNLDKYIEIIREACDFFGVDYIDLRTSGITIYNKDMYLPDGIHPNASGMKLITDCVLKHLTGSISLKNDTTSTLDKKKISILGDSISTAVDGNAVEFEVLQSDIDDGRTLSGYPTYYDIGTNIGGKSVDSSMVGVMTSFTPKEGDVGKVIGKSLNYNQLTKDKLWWSIMANNVGAEILQNVSWSGSSISSHEGSDNIYKTSYAWHDAQINKLSKRDSDGNVITPDIIIIYRGTNDMTHAPYTKITDFSHGATLIPDTDVISDGFGFKEAYCLTIKKIREKYPFAHIICCTLNVFKRVNYSEFPTNNGLNTLPEYNNAIREVANYMGCGLIEFDKDGITFENCYPTYISDSATIPTHPNENGHKKMSEKATKDLLFNF